MHIPKKDLPIDIVKSILDYNKDTGIFTWIKAGNNSRTGKIAGNISKNGYVVITIMNSTYKAHRLAWLYTYGEWPDDEIDHINGIKTDNRIVNLRNVTRRQNNQNRIEHRELHLPGIRKLCKKWQARIWHNGAHIHLGVYNTQEEAHEVYIEAIKSLGIECYVDDIRAKVSIE